MPKATGIARLTGLVGSVGNLTYCRDGTVRKRRTPGNDAFLHAPALQPLRDSAAALTVAAKVGAQLRAALAPYLLPYRGLSLNGRLVSALRRLITRDTTQPVGQRRLLSEHLPELVGFSFNPAASLPAALLAGCSLTPAPAGGLLLNIPPLGPAASAAAPRGATHYGLTVAIALLDLAAWTSRGVALPDLPAPSLLTDSSAGPVQLTIAPADAPTPAESVVVVLGLHFYRLSAGQLQPLTAATAPLAVAFAGAPAPLLAHP